MKHGNTQSGRAESFSADDWIWERGFSQPSDVMSTANEATLSGIYVRTDDLSPTDDEGFLLC